MILSDLILSKLLVISYFNFSKLVCNPNGQYSKKNRVTREEFSKSVLVLGDENSGLYKDSIQAFSNKNIKINNNSIIYSNDIDCMKEIILRSVQMI